MKIEKAIKRFAIKYAEGDVFFPTDEFGYWNINVSFISPNGKEDETQFDIRPIDFDFSTGECQDLIDLWEDFCRENDIDQNSVESLYMAG